MAQAAEDYSSQLHQEIDQTPPELLPELLDAMHVFKQALLDRPPLSEEEKAKIAEGVRQADAGQFASDEQVKQSFKRWGVNVKD